MSPQSKKLIFSLLVLIMSSLSGCATPAVDYDQVGKNEKIVIKFSHVVAESTPKGQAAKRFAHLVGKRTNGKVEVQVYPNSILYKDGEEFEALKSNRIQMIAPATAKLSDEYPQWQIFDLPFLFSSYEHVHRIMDGPVGTQLSQLLETRNMQVMAMWDNGFKAMSANRPLIKVDDFKGLTFRIMSSKVLEAQFHLLGANAIMKPFDVLYQNLESGLVDGAENPPSNFYSKRFQKVQNYLTLSEHGYLGYVVIVNKEFLDGLPPDIRKTLEETLNEVTAWEREIADEENIKAIEAIKASGDTQVYKLTPQEKEVWKNKLAPLFTQFETVIGKKMIKSVQDAK